MIVCSKCNTEKTGMMFIKKTMPSLCKACYAKEYRMSDSQKEYIKEYSKLPDVRAKKAERERMRRMRPEVKEMIAKYRNRLDVITRTKETRKKYQSTSCQDAGFKEKKRAYMREYQMRPEVSKAKKEYEKRYAQYIGVHERKLLYAKEYSRKPEVKDKMTIINRVSIESATDRYIKSVIRQRTGRILSAKDISPEIIELQRQSLILKRTIKQKNKENE